MTLRYGPVTTHIIPFTLSAFHDYGQTDPHLGPVTAGSTITFGWTTAARTSGTGVVRWAVYDMATNTYLAFTDFDTATASPQIYTFTADAGDVYVYAWSDSNRGAWTLTGVEIDLSSTAYCEFGTEESSTGQLIFYLTPGVIDAILVASGMTWLAPFVTAWWFTQVNTKAICDIGAPPAPELTLSDLVPPNFEKIHAALEAASWNYFCQCKPAPLTGIRPPNPPPPTLTAPVGLPPASDFAVECDTGDICVVLNRLSQMMMGLNSQLQLVRRDVTLIQRQDVPFAYVAGTTHSSLSGSGHIVVQGILGLSLVFTTIPTFIGLEAGEPQENLFLGHLSIGTIEGWQSRIPLTHNPQLVLNISGAATRIGYTLTPGVVVDVLELLREP
jgi:hypothetical protein